MSKHFFIGFVFEGLRRSVLVSLSCVLLMCAASCVGAEDLAPAEQRALKDEIEAIDSLALDRWRQLPDRITAHDLYLIEMWRRSQGVLLAVLYGAGKIGDPILVGLQLYPSPKQEGVHNLAVDWLCENDENGIAIELYRDDDVKVGTISVPECVTIGPYRRKAWALIAPRPPGDVGQSEGTVTVVDANLHTSIRTVKYAIVRGAELNKVRLYDEYESKGMEQRRRPMEQGGEEVEQEFGRSRNDEPS